MVVHTLSHWQVEAHRLSSSKGRAHTLTYRKIGVHRLTFWKVEIHRVGLTTCHLCPPERNLVRIKKNNSNLRYMKNGMSSGIFTDIILYVLSKTKLDSSEKMLDGSP